MACSLALIMEVMRMQKKMVEEGKKRLNILLEMGLWDEVTKAFDIKCQDRMYKKYYIKMYS